jgi:hypothetical protein
MGLSDRDYMRPKAGGAGPSARLPRPRLRDRLKFLFWRLRTMFKTRT